MFIQKDAFDSFLEFIIESLNYLEFYFEKFNEF